MHRLRWSVLALIPFFVCSCSNQRLPKFDSSFKTYSNSIGMKFVRVESGTFLMGSPADEPVREDGEDRHEVEITRPFFIGAYEVTQLQYEAVMGENPSYFQEGGKGSNYINEVDTKQLPVESINYEMAVEFCKRLNELEKGAPFSYRLPTEAEWEYACRAGSKTPLHWGEKFEGGHANCRGAVYPPVQGGEWLEFLSRTSVVGSYEPNAWGIYDMSGNVWEWTADWYDKDYYKQSPKQDPQGPTLAADASEDEKKAFAERYLQKTIRGGSWGTMPAVCRSANRKNTMPTNGGSDQGLRIVLVPDDVSSSPVADDSEPESDSGSESESDSAGEAESDSESDQADGEAESDSASEGEAEGEGEGDSAGESESDSESDQAP